MQKSNSLTDYVSALETQYRFVHALHEESHKAVPDDCLIAVTDVVGSRAAIARGDYKAVNMAGVAMISAVMNGLQNQQIPFSFGGDGAAVLVGQVDRESLEQILAATITWVKEDLDLELRAAIVDISSLRNAGSDVRIAKVRVSDAINNYAFFGGGVSLAEKWMKEGKFRIEPAPSGSRPDLQGLSCRWTPIEPKEHKIVSIIVEPGFADPASFGIVASEFMSMSASSELPANNPMPENGPGFSWPPSGLELEAKASRGEKPLASQKAQLYLITLLAWILDKTGISVGGFSPKRYREFTSLNTDYRKIQDGVRVTISLGEKQLETLKTWLETKRKKGLLRYGICVQNSAVLTCYVPSIMSDEHLHFLDGGGGGYAEAANSMQD